MNRRTSGWPTSSVPLRHLRLTRDGHAIAFTVAGDPAAPAVVVLHGGPGSASQPGMLALFDLAKTCVVFVDQRGAGQSLPRGGLRANRTDHLVADLEAIRRALGISRWGVVGGSWGAALALAYAGQHPASVLGVVMRGLFLTSRYEVRRLFVTSRRRAPGAWQRLCAAAGCTRANALLARCAKRLRPGVAYARQREVAFAWRAYEEAILASSRPGGAAAARPHRATSPKAARTLIAKYRIQAHYLLHDCWLGERRLLSFARTAEQAGVPIYSVHGLRDPVCPVRNVDRLAAAAPTARIARVRGGHLASDPELKQSVVQAVRAMLAGAPESAGAALSPTRSAVQPGRRAAHPRRRTAH
ncbi:alpha/beta fold hydrolase [Paraburkholderia sacchari]|uniref:Proline iminopeptidase n=1 Tax=Paraburkholderia sacchari TaxID=159450 RepID=A0A8T6Z6K2_9BURK|nr:alpha/beta fold hydrolase [Paraburkholderia sacchari]NLP60233.1 alpha/beta fold hydrolase [Paraburkholderia sacchari]